MLTHRPHTSLFSLLDFHCFLKCLKNKMHENVIHVKIILSMKHNSLQYEYDEEDQIIEKNEMKIKMRHKNNINNRIDDNMHTMHKKH